MSSWLHKITLPAPGPADLFRPLDHNLAIASILAGYTPGELYVDLPEAPSLGLAWFHGRVFLTGEPAEPSVTAVQDVLRRVLIPQQQAAGSDAFILHVASPAWEAHVEALAPGIEIIRATRQYYACHALPPEPRSDLPPSMELTPADASLLRRLNPAGRAALSDEICSERPSVDDFLKRSYGVCLVQGDELVGWCLSEYNLEGRCEVGVAIMEPYQRRGLGALMTVAFVQMALSHGIHTLGWHCWQRNIASGALARRAGFHLVDEHLVYIYLIA